MRNLNAPAYLAIIGVALLCGCNKPQPPPTADNSRLEELEARLKQAEAEAEMARSNAAYAALPSPKPPKLPPVDDAAAKAKAKAAQAKATAQYVAARDNQTRLNYITLQLSQLDIQAKNVIAATDARIRQLNFQRSRAPKTERNQQLYSGYIDQAKASERTQLKALHAQVVQCRNMTADIRHEPHPKEEKLVFRR